MQKAICPYGTRRVIEEQSFLALRKREMFRGALGPE
jgi:hypothetical protein